MPSWFDRFGQEWATTGLTDDPTNAQADAGWAYIGPIPPTVEQFNSMFQWSGDKDNWLYGQIGNVIASANMVPDPNDLTQLLRAITHKLKLKLTGPYTIWVDSINGNDNNLTPSQGTPFRTIQHSIDWALENIEPAHQWVYIQLQPGTYEPFSHTVTFNGGIVVQGDNLNPRNYLVKNTNGICAQAAYGAWFICQGMSFEAQGNDTNYDTSGCAFVASQGGAILYKDVAFGQCSNSHMWASAAGYITSWGGVNYTIYGGTRAHMLATTGGGITNVLSHVTLQNNPLFTIGFAYVGQSGFTQSWSSTYTGTASAHAWGDTYGTLNTGGVNPDVHFPGDAPAQYARGAVYI